MNRQTLEAAVIASFVGEIEAFKPGNVSVYADGHDMTVEDFLRSAKVSASILCKPQTSLGQRVLESVKATQKAVACNTNLGMLLLFAPIIMAAESAFHTEEDLRHHLEIVLKALTQEDTVQIFEAIRTANPGGLGKVKSQDVNKMPQCGLIEAMQLASNRDFVALQYVNNFKDVFETGFSAIKDFDKSWNSVKWATVSCYLIFLSSITDSHIQRKYGINVAEKIKIRSGEVAKSFLKASNPETEKELILEFDEELKANNFNPGTCADLTAASLLVYNLMK